MQDVADLRRELENDVERALVELELDLTLMRQRLEADADDALGDLVEKVIG